MSGYFAPSYFPRSYFPGAYWPPMVDELVVEPPVVVQEELGGATHGKKKKGKKDQFRQKLPRNIDLLEQPPAVRQPVRVPTLAQALAPTVTPIPFGPLSLPSEQPIPDLPDLTLEQERSLERDIELLLLLELV